MAVTDRGDLQSYLDGRGLMVDIRSVEGIAPPPPRIRMSASSMAS